MIHSMTAFAAKRIALGPAAEATWELRSVNNRFLDLSFRLSDPWRPLEPELRQRLAGRIKRGKVEVRLQLQHTAESPPPAVDPKALAALAQLQATIRDHFPDAPPFSVGEIAQWPGVLSGDADDTEAQRAALLAAFDAAVDELIAHRAREGAQLAAALETRAQQLREWVREARRLAPEAHARYAAQLSAALAQITTPETEDRIRQEVALYVQKVDVAEELDRLDAHLDELAHTLTRDGPVGKRLDFLMQEFHREANTLSAKAAHPDLTRIALEMKVLIEQMREQVQNIE